MKIYGRSPVQDCLPDLTIIRHPVIVHEEGLPAEVIEDAKAALPGTVITLRRVQYSKERISGR
jgi:hypothetical protein